MNTIFVDTSALIALGNKRDDLHQKAKRVRKALIQQKCAFLTTNAVLLELCNAFSAVPHRNSALQLINAIQQSKNWKCFEIDPLMKPGLELFRNRPDKEWSLVDCQSILVAQQFRVTDVFTNDHHFEQAGFNVLL